jgi:hypothetical protein
MGKQPIILTNEIAPTPALVRAGMDALPMAIAAQGERASRRFIEFFTATIRNRNTRMAYARAVKDFFDCARIIVWAWMTSSQSPSPHMSSSSAPRPPSLRSSKTWPRSVSCSIT